MGDAWRGGAEASSTHSPPPGSVESVDALGGTGNVYGGQTLRGGIRKEGRQDKLIGFQM